jgi:hypothetical protein
MLNERTELTHRGKVSRYPNFSFRSSDHPLEIVFAMTEGTSAGSTSNKRALSPSNLDEPVNLSSSHITSDSRQPSNSDPASSTQPGAESPIVPQTQVSEERPEGKRAKTGRNKGWNAFGDSIKKRGEGSGGEWGSKAGRVGEEDDGPRLPKRKVALLIG